MNCQVHSHFFLIVQHAVLRQTRANLYCIIACTLGLLTNHIFFFLLFRNESDEPIKVLRTFVAHLLRGRPLDIRDESELIEGPTTEIFVSRLNIYEDGMDELLSGTSPDYSIPLEVTFTGECAQDLGGPRKEFLGAMMREIRFKLFTEKDGEGTFVLRDDMIAVNRMHYLGAGIIFGTRDNHYYYTVTFVLFSYFFVQLGGEHLGIFHEQSPFI